MGRAGLEPATSGLKVRARQAETSCTRLKRAAKPHRSSLQRTTAKCSLWRQACTPTVRTLCWLCRQCAPDGCPGDLRSNELEAFDDPAQVGLDQGAEVKSPRRRPHGEPNYAFASVSKADYLVRSAVRLTASAAALIVRP